MNLKWIKGIFIGLPLIISASIYLSPNSSDNFQLNYAFFLVKNLTLEISAVIFLVIIISTPISYWKKLTVYLKNLFLSANTKSRFFLIFSLGIPISFIFPLSEELYYLARARVYYIQNLIIDDYRDQVLGEVFEHATSGKYRYAIEHYQKFEPFFTNDYLFSYHKSSLKKIERAMFHSYYLHEKHEHLKKENGETSIHGVFMMAEAASFNPGDNFITSEFIGSYENFSKNLKEAQLILRNCYENIDEEGNIPYSVLSIFLDTDIFRLLLVQEYPDALREKEMSAEAFCAIAEKLGDKKTAWSALSNYWSKDSLSGLSAKLKRLTTNPTSKY